MNAIVKHEGQAPSTFTEEQIDTIKNMYCKGATNDELKVFLYTCERTGLDPFAKQVFAIKRGSAMTIQTSIDGYRLVAERTGRYCPGQKPTYEYDEKGKLLSATAYVKKLTKDGTWHIVEAEAAFSEYVQSYNGKPSGLWEKMPRVMLAKCAEALAIRKCFPAELSSVYTKEEMAQADSEEIEVHSTPVKPVEYITPEEHAELTQILAGCDPEKFDKIDSFIRKRCNGGDLTYLRKEQYSEIKNMFLEGKRKYEAEQAEAKKISDFVNGEVKDEC